jgi:cysteine-rich repeat protein
MKTIRTLNRFLSLGFCVAAISACNPDSDASTGSDGATGTESEGSDTTVDPTNTTGNTDPGLADGRHGLRSDRAAVEGTEECDDGNQEDGDGCESTARVTAVCGNGRSRPARCATTATRWTATSAAPTADQVPTPDQVCGNGMVEEPEVCDDGNQVNGDGCEADCTITPAECGNGKVEGDEECDDGNDVNGGPGDFCKNDCTVFVPPPARRRRLHRLRRQPQPRRQGRQDQRPQGDGHLQRQPANSVQITNFSSLANNAAWQVAKGFGTYKFDDDMDPNTPDKLLYSPREGDTFLMVSTGVIKAPNGQGIVIEANNSQGGNGDNGNDVPDSMPAPLSDEVGSNNGAGGTPFIHCDGVNDCSDTLFEPSGTTSRPATRTTSCSSGSTPRSRRARSATPSTSCSARRSGRRGSTPVQRPVDRVADRPDAGRPERRPAGRPVHRQRHVHPRPERPDQGPAADDHGARPVLRARASAATSRSWPAPGSRPTRAPTGSRPRAACSRAPTSTIGFFITDMGDSILATMAILDNFRWDCEGCVPSEVDDCGVQQPSRAGERRAGRAARPSRRACAGGLVVLRGLGDVVPLVARDALAVVRVLAAVVGEADEARGVVAADVRGHDRALGPALEAVLRPVVGVQHALLVVGEGPVRDAVVEHEVELPVEPEGADVAAIVP